jgi:quinol monooxygenase YgiN
MERGTRSPAENSTRSTLEVFARIEAKPGSESALARVLVQHLPDVRRTPGCLLVHDYGSIRDARLLYVHSRWSDLENFERYACSPETDRFVHKAEEHMASPPLQAIRTVALEPASAAPLPAGELYVFAPFRARAGEELGVEHALRSVRAATATEPGCLAHRICRSAREAEAALFYVHSIWTSEAAFEQHAAQAHTTHFIEQVEPLIDHALEVTRARRIG